jgi:hypothetical protein
VASDSELMLKALTAERGESPNARRIERASAQARVESLRRRAATVVTTWKDPFAEDPERLVEVRMPAPRKSQRRDEVAVMRRDLARARAETAAAQATAAAAQAEAARAKANTARAEAEAARVQAVAARHEAAAARAECVATDRVKRPVRVREAEGRDDHVGFGRLAVARGGSGRSENGGPRLAAKPRPQRPAATPAKVSVSSNEAPAPADDLTEPPPPPEVHAAAPGGIIVVPITR